MGHSDTPGLDRPRVRREQIGPDPVGGSHPAATIGLRSLPTRAISISTVSPGWRNTGGLRPMPTPGGVPVKIRSPGFRVQTLEMYAISVGQREDPLPGVGLLHHGPVQPQADIQLTGISHLVRRDQFGTAGCEGIEGLAQQPLAGGFAQLPVAGGDIIAAGVAGHQREGLVGGDLLALPADDHDQFGFVVDLPTDLRQHDRLPGRGEGRGELVEDHGLGGDRHLRFGGVIGVVQADANDLLRIGHRGEQGLRVGGQGLSPGDRRRGPVQARAPRASSSFSEAGIRGSVRCRSIQPFSWTPATRGPVSLW